MIFSLITSSSRHFSSLFGTTTAYLGLLQVIWDYYSLFGTTTAYLGLLQVIWDYYSLFGTTTAYLGLLQLIWDYSRLFGTTTAYLGLLQPIWDYYSLFGTTPGYLGLLQLIWDYSRLFGTTTAYLGLLQLIWDYYDWYYRLLHVPQFFQLSFIFFIQSPTWYDFTLLFFGFFFFVFFYYHSGVDWNGKIFELIIFFLLLTKLSGLRGMFGRSVCSPRLSGDVFFPIPLAPTGAISGEVNNEMTNTLVSYTFVIVLQRWHQLGMKVFGKNLLHPKDKWLI